MVKFGFLESIFFDDAVLSCDGDGDGDRNSNSNSVWSN